jgi:cytochrome c peroxidase
MKRAPVVLGVSLVIAGSLSACTDETTFTAEERDILTTYKLPASPPANPSNRVADIPAAAALGKKFFFDKRFSGALGAANDGVSGGSLGNNGDKGKVACFDCHQLDLGGADRRSRTPTSLGANYGLRNAPTVINAAFWDVATGGWQLWDGRKDSLWALALGPMEGPNEHNGTRLQYAHLVYDKYKAEYEAVFGGSMPDMNELLPDGVTLRFPLIGKPTAPGGTPGPANIPFDSMPMADKGLINRIYSNIGKAMEAYERQLVSPNFELSAFDKMLTGDDSAMTPAAIRGAKLFVGKAACNECHRGAMFTDFRFHNIGCPQQGSNVPALDLGRQNGIKIARNGLPGGTDVMSRAGVFSDDPQSGHLEALAVDQAFDLGSFRTPTLRNIEKTGPYMHDGVYTNLWDVVSHYNFGGGTGSFSGTKEAAISPLLLSNDEMDDLVEFLRSLSDGPPRETSLFPEGLLAAPMLP